MRGFTYPYTVQIVIRCFVAALICLNNAVDACNGVVVVEHDTETLGRSCSTACHTQVSLEVWESSTILELHELALTLAECIVLLAALVSNRGILYYAYHVVSCRFTISKAADGSH